MGGPHKMVWFRSILGCEAGVGGAACSAALWLLDWI